MTGRQERGRERGREREGGRERKRERERERERRERCTARDATHCGPEKGAAGRARTEQEKGVLPSESRRWKQTSGEQARETFPKGKFITPKTHTKRQLTSCARPREAGSGTAHAWPWRACGSPAVRERRREKGKSVRSVSAIARDTLRLRGPHCSRCCGSSSRYLAPLHMATLHPSAGRFQPSCRLRSCSQHTPGKGPCQMCPHMSTNVPPYERTYERHYLNTPAKIDSHSTQESSSTAEGELAQCLKASAPRPPRAASSSDSESTNTVSAPVSAASLCPLVPPVCICSQSLPHAPQLP